ncbi:unnamed protein product [Didymodactylos carnosus]|uniref:Uncharacterized protein n=1 Tax=Didymodactylos carnosus TaxID=1234261 RepID=A0A814JPK1_9BILA|nr:unnamed protein product [Didymodactylos carnosus]CAF1612419.1 unnamed protein product [Didymodactylos carnosus]CAF3811056.1 unnamed protein product [Didymodactylos carnosus]CAF4427109.1 unnamed protein product [Didymodactylos carnosus]
MEYFCARLLGVKTSFYHWEEKPADELTIHNLTLEQLQTAGKVRSYVDAFQTQAKRELKSLLSKNRSFQQCLRSLSKDKSVVITRPDKGRGIVILNSSEYLSKMNNLLADTSTFIKIDTDPTLFKEDQLTRILLHLRE